MRMNEIATFNVDHTRLFPGLYVSRRDKFGEAMITTFDLRMRTPNKEPVMDMPAVHTIEHLGAYYLRNSNIKDKIVYFGPMGCRTGFCLLLYSFSTSEEIFEEILAMCDFILSFSSSIPGASEKECGNYLEQNLDMAKFYIRKYKNELIEHRRFSYGE